MRVSAEPEVMTFTLPHDIGVKKVLKVVNHWPRKAKAHLKTYIILGGSGTAMHMPNELFEPGYTEKEIEPYGAVELDITFKNIDLSVIQGHKVFLPSRFLVAVLYFQDENHWVDHYVPIKYITSKEHYVHSEHERCNLQDCCAQCHRNRGLYSCGECEHRMCVDCVHRWGAEAHASRFGSNHLLRLFPGAIVCGKCEQHNTGSIHICSGCVAKGRQDAIICDACSSDYENLAKHMKDGKDAPHSSIRIEYHPVALRQPKSHHQASIEDTKCGKCQSIITYNFFQCSSCPRELNLCAHCADGGGLSGHAGHEFQFLVPRITQAVQSDF